MALALTDFIPTPEEISPDAVIAARQRFEAFLSQFWAELDTRPNSVFGDISLTPFAAMVVAVETAMDRFRSDLNLNNVAQGVIFDDAFVRTFLGNFGVISRPTMAATGTVKLTFNVDTDYVIDGDTTFTFGAQVFKINPEEGSPVTVYNTASDGGRRMLTKTGDSIYEVFLPVYGAPGSLVNDQDQAATTLSNTELTGVVASGNFDSGLPPESTAQLAAKAQKTFASANLTSRSGITSFMAIKFPQILGATATITGDPEMIRAGRNPLGLLEGAIDVFVRSRTNFLSGEATLPLTYDLDAQAWVGQLRLPVIPSFMAVKSGIFQVNNFLNERGVNKLYARSIHPYVDNLGISYSRYEMLGIKVVDTNPADFQAPFISDVTNNSKDGSTLSVQGEYASDVFNAKSDRSVTIRFDSVTTYQGLSAIQANVRDKSSNEVGTVFLVANNTVSPTSGILVKGTLDYKRMLNGLDLVFNPQGGVFDPSIFIGMTFDFSFRGRTANFTVSYLYDPAIVQVDSVLQDPDSKPVNVSVLTRSPIVCYISNYVVSYRVPFGGRVDQSMARQFIANYINSIIFPNTYEEATIGNLIASLGGVLQSISKRGTFYPSLAGVYRDANGVETTIPRMPTTTLLPPLNDKGFGRRNICYLLDSDNITFNVTVS
jgi:hypothetical protein